MKLRVLLLTLVFALAHAAPPANLIDNGDFSKPTTSQFVNGVVVPGWESVTPEVVVAEGSGHVMRLGKNNQNWSAAHLPVAVPPGARQIQCALRVRSSEGAEAKYEVALIALDANRKGLNARGVATADGVSEKLAVRADALRGKSWKTVRFQKALPPNAAFFVLVLTAVPRTGPVDFADVVCTAE